jgi:hypothetical protein
LGTKSGVPFPLSKFKSRLANAITTLARRYTPPNYADLRPQQKKSTTLNDVGRLRASTKNFDNTKVEKVLTKYYF